MRWNAGRYKTSCNTPGSHWPCTNLRMSKSPIPHIHVDCPATAHTAQTPSEIGCHMMWRTTISEPSVWRGWVVIKKSHLTLAVLWLMGPGVFHMGIHMNWELCRLELELRLCALTYKAPDDECGEERGGLGHSSFQCPMSGQFAHLMCFFPFSNFCCTLLTLLRRQGRTWDLKCSHYFLLLSCHATCQVAY